MEMVDFLASLFFFIQPFQKRSARFYVIATREPRRLGACVLATRCTPLEVAVSFADVVVVVAAAAVVVVVHTTTTITTSPSRLD